MIEEPGTIQLSHQEQTLYCASHRQGVTLLDAGVVADRVGVSHAHAVKLLSSMARKNALHRVG